MDNASFQSFLQGFATGEEQLLSVVQDDGFVVGGLQITEDRATELFQAIEDQFGELERQPFDFAAGKLFLLDASNEVTLGELIAELAIPRVGDIVGQRASVQRGGEGVALLLGQDLASLQDQIVSDIEGVLGPTAVRTFDGEDDLALTLDYGPAVAAEDVRSEIRGRALTGVFTSEVAENTFSLISTEPIAEDDRTALLAGLENVLGPAIDSSFQEFGDLAIRLDFTNAAEVAALRDAVADFSGQAIFVTPLEGNNFAFTGESLREQRDALIEALRSQFGEAQDFLLPVDVGFAINLDFGRVISLEEMRDVLREIGPENVTVGLVDQGILLAANSVDEERRQALSDDLAARFGPATETPVDFGQRSLFTISFSDPARVEAGVTEDFIIQADGRNRFFIAGARLSEDQQSALLFTMRDAFGQITLAEFDFNEGVASLLTFEQPVSEGALRQRLADFGYADLQLEQRGDLSWFMRSGRPLQDQRSTILRALSELAPVDQDAVEFATVDAEIAKRSILNTFWAVLAGTVGILLYVWWAFRRIPKSFRYGAAAVVALAHDVIVTLGVFGLLAKFANVEINSLMIVGILAVIGYSVNNTIVVFDRIRENVARATGRDYEGSVNVSLNETLTRNLNTTVTTLVAVLAVLLFGGETIRDFMVVIAVGVLAGSYSSLFLAPNLLVSSERGELPRLRIPFFGQRRSPAYR